MKNKALPGPIRATNCVFFIGFALFLLFAPGRGPARAVPLLDENFDNYSLGNVSGQGGWIGGDGAEVVSDTRSFSGTQSLKLSGAQDNSLSINFASTTYNVFYLEFNFYISTTTHTEFIAVPLISSPPGGGALYNEIQDVSGSIKLYTDNEGGSAGGCSGLPRGVWNNVKILATFTPVLSVQYSCNGAAYSDPQPGQTIGDIDHPFIFLNLQKGFYYGTAEVYIDDIYLDNSDCVGYLNRSDCISGGCYWQSIIFHEEYDHCITYPEGESADTLCARNTFDCAYCNASTTCLNVGCYWNNLQGCSYYENLCDFDNLGNCENETDCENASGSWNGDFCFVSEIAPVDCSTMPLLERLVCEIKNFISTAFLPSKEKISELGRTIDLVNTKFPSNYLRAARIFFDDVKNGINESAGIPVRILGHQENVNFDIFNATGTAGVVNTIGNVIKTFITLVLLGLFIAWSIEFLKRIFK